jgi:hypothetical protein
MTEGGVALRAGPIGFSAEALANLTLPPRDVPGTVAFQQKVARLQRAVLGAVQTAAEARTHLDLLSNALDQAPAARPELRERAKKLTGQLRELQASLTGDPVLARHDEPRTPSIESRVGQLVENLWSSRSETPPAAERSYAIAGSQFERVLAKLREALRTDLPALDAEAELAGAPWTPGRVPDWKME